ncbi:hypothetical protein GA0115240_16152 [Streptomyces sp. DvalAA-14]|uniref:hypothetical protein n=1 Tax=unclassified Streptomyces TaxID=2593676 RepID=UPI00081B4D0F|nr:MULTISPECIES: hypothetical protein [unclassified Streptomyces]MYS24226.1 hypothetical protein [Streptomyces sp. SID4948]SCE43938.1 hypothetical protein GA0115240_16152 [Streptomyces sp. DvalAA-14]
MTDDEASAPPSHDDIDDIDDIDPQDRRSPGRLRRATEMISALGVLAGIGFGVWSLYQSSRALDYQGDQLSSQVKAQEMSQAVTVNLVPAAEFSADHLTYTLVNRSQDPISRVKLYVAFEKPHGRYKGYFDYEVWNTVPRCSEVTFDLRAIAQMYPATAHMDLSGSSGTKFDVGVVFADAAGKTWHRHPSGFINGTPWLEKPEDGTRSPVLPDAFHGYQPLTDHRIHAVPAAGRPFVLADKSAASGCSGQ